MFLSVQELEQRKLLFATDFAPGEIDYLENQLRQTGPLQVAGSAELLKGTGEIRIRGHLTVPIEVDCDRCLEAAALPVDHDFDLFYREDIEVPEGEEVEIGEGEIEIGFYKGDGIDLKDVLREQVLLALPMQRICSEACQGICPVCGENRNRVHCECRAQLGDDRWAALSEFTKAEN